MKTIPGFDIKIFTDNIEQEAIDQLTQLLSIDVFADKRIRIMPDVHSGSGCVIGFTGNLGDKVIPNIVGVDIGCGMRVIKFRLPEAYEIDFHAFHTLINQAVPSGMTCRDEAQLQLSDNSMLLYQEAQELVHQLRCLDAIKHTDRIYLSAGTLGGGNHFIELNRDDAGFTYLVIHTGSRNLGKQVADIYQKQAVLYLAGEDKFNESLNALIAEYKATGRQTEINGAIQRARKAFLASPAALPAELCYLEGERRDNYLHDMRLCQRWAIINRQIIALELMKFFPEAEIVEQFETVHNYISDAGLIRKGSISAEKGERCIIPLNMRDGSLICTGKGNEDWNCSAPHGAGRIMSRSKANKLITMDDFRQSMAGIYSESVNEATRDESPMAYKPAAEIIANIHPTVDIDAIIRPIFNFKASN